MLKLLRRNRTGRVMHAGLPILALLLAWSPEAIAAEFLVSSASDIHTAMQSAQPGDTLVMTNGTWTNQQISFAGFGASGSPITLRAEQPGGVTLNGNSSLNISGDWLVVDGLHFDGGALGANDHIVEFRGANGEATNSRFTNSAIVNYNPASIDTRYFWVSMYGQNNRVDHNYFSGQNHSGVTVTVWRNSSDADFHQIDNNHFADRPRGNGNGFETIRVGTSTESLSDSFTTVENNLFERVDGEIEIISNKAGNNTYRYNTFRESSGTLTLRHGNDNLVEGNFFLGDGVNGSGGVRVIGERQTLVNNYFHGLDGRAGGAISISAGVPNSALNEYYQVRDAVIAHNTIVDVMEAAIVFDDGLGSSGRTLLAQDVTIANNLVRSSADPLFEGAQGSGWVWTGNVAFGQSLGTASGNPGITVTDPELVLGEGGVYRLAPTSPAINMGSLGYSSFAVDDIDGHTRDSLPDIGADEFSTFSMVRLPLTSSDVGPSWLLDNNPTTPSGGGCGPDGCALQAEEYTSVLDPDGNGFAWRVETASDALGGEVLVAPSGDRVDLPAEPHDTLATYTFKLESEGEYTLYYRARGFNGSSDSLYTPDAFAADPHLNETISSNGRFQWEKGPEILFVDQANTGVPLELRVGMREAGAEFDAFVIHVDGSLSDAELDALFDVIEGDFNGDGFVDAGDYALWRDTAGLSGASLAADASEDGQVDNEDLAVWRRHFGSALGSSVEPAVEVPEAQSLGLCVVASLIAIGQSQRLSARRSPTPSQFT